MPPFNGGGSFSPPAASFPAVASTLIEAVKFNAVINDIATNGLSNCITKDGQTTPTANIPMAGNKLTGLGAATTNGDAVRYEQVIGAFLPITGGTLTGNLLFTDATYDVGASGATRPRDLFLSRNAVIGGTLNVTGHPTLEGVTATGATGTGKMVYDTSPTLVTPLLGTPTSGTLTNCTGLPVAGISNFTPTTASLGADVNLSNTGQYFDGPSIAQGSTGTWFVSGTVTLLEATASPVFDVKLWDGTTVIASTKFYGASSGGQNYTCSLSGYIAAPAGNLRISVKDETSTGGKIVYNASGNSKDSTITAFRIA